MKIKEFKKSVPTFVIMSVFSIIMIAAIYHILTPKKVLPVYNPADVNPKLVDESVFHIRRNHTISNFSLINQNGETITHKDYENTIYVADFFFTRCLTICPIMTNNMKILQDAFLSDSDVKFLSHSVTPDIDSVAVLKQYAIQKGVVDKKWNITTGNKKHIYELARKSYFAVLDEGDGGLQDFIHTENFILVDKNKQIRGFYDGTNLEDIERLKGDILLLKSEEK